MSNWDKERLLRSSILAGFTAALLAGGQAWAQEPVLTDEEEDEVEEAEEDAGDRIVVTGSRIRRDEFSSIKPVQIISGEVARDVGLFSATEIIQESTVATGLQIDETFIGFVSDNGPGATNIDLRGLGPQRTLVLVNGRRIGPAGSEGAPNVPDLSLIPGSLIDRVDLLLDGASSIYGSDAVAGVVNAILRTDFDGFEVEASTTVPEQSGGAQHTVSGRWGVNADRGFMGFGFEYQLQENMTLNDRDYFGDCATNVEITSTGEIRRNNAGLARSDDAFLTDCTTAFGINRLFINGFADVGSLYGTPGTTNFGVPGFSEYSLYGIQDFDGDGVTDVRISDPFWQSNGYPQQRIQDVLPETERFSMFTYGEYNLGSQFDVVAFFEAGAARRETQIGGNGSVAFFPTVPADSPFNPCNPNTPAASPISGVDCGLAHDAVLNDPVYRANFANFYEGLCADFGFSLAQCTPNLFGLYTGGLGPLSVEAQYRVNLQGEDRFTTTEVTQTRFVAGFRGILPDPEILPLSNIAWEISASHDRSRGTTDRFRFDEDRLALSLLTTIEDPSNPGEFICGLDVNGDGIPDPATPFPNGSNEAPDCVPINPFATSLYGIGGGDFATQEEYDYLRANRGFATTVEQTLIQAFVSADLFELPAGTVAGVLGFEYREDSIDSDPHDTTRQGRALGFFRDFGSNGTRDLYEVFYEVEVPLIAQQPLVEELTINHSGRFTEETNFGNAYTYSLSGVYRPNNFLTFRGGYGTSFRAPNLEEQFVEGISGFLGYTDPCLVPDNAYDAVGGYDPTEDNREQITLDNCVLAGVDPTTLGGPTTAPGSIEVFTVGNDVLAEETSTSINAGLVFEQPWFDAFDLQFSATYYEIEVEDTLVRTGLATAVDQCFNQLPNLSSVFCSLIERDPSTGFIVRTDLPFANQDAETAVGVDYNMVVTRDWTVFDRNVTTGLDLRANNTLERESITRVPGADPIPFNNLGQEFFPHWNGTFRGFVDYDDFRFTWNTRWTGKTDDNEFQEAFPENGPANTDTCNATGDLLCKDLETVDDHFRHDVSLRYNADTWTIVGGVRNVFDEAPALVDPSENFELNGTNRFAGHDFIGRRFFLNVQKRF
ncbi:MAG: TonB-dependent receptor [Oceanicaulis sp.]